MTKKNYEEMKDGKTPEIVIPYNDEEYSNSDYHILVTAVVFYHAPVFGCILNTDSESKIMLNEEAGTHTSKLVYTMNGSSLLDQSGLYTFVCTITQPNSFTNLTHRQFVSKSLYLKIVKGILIVL